MAMGLVKFDKSEEFFFFDFLSFTAQFHDFQRTILRF